MLRRPSRADHTQTHRCGRRGALPRSGRRPGSGGPRPPGRRRSGTARSPGPSCSSRGGTADPRPHERRAGVRVAGAVSSAGVPVHDPRLPLRLKVGVPYMRTGSPAASQNANLTGIVWPALKPLPAAPCPRAPIGSSKPVQANAMTNVGRRRALLVVGVAAVGGRRGGRADHVARVGHVERRVQPARTGHRGGARGLRRARVEHRGGAADRRGRRGPARS